MEWQHDASRAALASTASISITVFAVSSMLSVGLAYRIGRILGLLADVRAVFRALVANFVLVPLLAVGIEQVIPIDPRIAIGLFLLAGSAGAPFLIKLAGAARSDLGLCAALLLLLVPATIVFLPYYVPLAMARPSLRSLSYVPSGAAAIGLPLLSTLIVPILAGFAVKAIAPVWAGRLVPITGKIATVALVVVVVSTFGANFHDVIRIVKNGALLAGVLLILGAFLSGFLLSRPERSAVLGLGTAQRNVAAAMVIASRDFTEPDILVMITASVLVGLLLLFVIASLLSRRTPHIGPPTPEVWFESRPVPSSEAP
jgi:BASS family bile acid:Na+ symporter